MQPWMRKEVLTKFGRTVKNRWSAKSSPQNPFSHPFRGDIAPLPVNKRIRFWKLARGDRVRVVRGEHKGKEGVIRAIDNSRNQVIVAGVNVEPVRIPEGIRLARDPLFQDVQYPLEYSDLRLVWELPRKYRDRWERLSMTPLINPQKHPSGKWRIVIDKLVLTRRFIDPKTGRQSFNRIIPGLNIMVPWPKRPFEFKETEQDRMEKAKDPIKFPDTPTPLVSKQTFRNPTLAYPPLPAGIELELHNPYSRFKRQKFARAAEQMAEWKRRFVAGVKEAEELSKEIEEKDRNIYTPEQLRIRAANKLVKKARKIYFKRKEMTDDDVLLIAERMRAHIDSKLKYLISPDRTIEPLTPLEQGMTASQRLAHRRKRAVLEKQQLLERKLKAEEEVTRKKMAALENKGRNKTFDIQRSVKMPTRTRKAKKKKGKARMPAR